jgi:hypothetical protein
VYKNAVLGGSNADRLGVAMMKDVDKITKSGWRPSKKGVEELLKLMEGQDLEDHHPVWYGQRGVLRGG